ncbi:MAG: hypothetical protein AB8B63_14500 [Granulosicoccus sp.]
MSVLSACGGGSNNSNSTVALPQPRNTLPDLNIANASFNEEHHAGSASCNVCHNYSDMTVETDTPGETRNVSIGTAWETSVMAQSARDPYWHAVVASELDYFPHLEEVINDKCTVCHAPMAHDLARKTGQKLSVFDTGSIENGDFQRGIYSMAKEDETGEDNDLFNHAMDGVSCSLCHQMDGGNFGTEESMTGGFVIAGSPTGIKADRPAYGQYTDPEVGYMRNNAEFLAQYGPHISTSESCATCHNLNIEPVDPEGNPIEGGEHFAEQAVFTEWLNSDYAVGGSKEASCQSCHMPKVEQDVFIAEGASNKRSDFAEHTFLGANTVMQDMMSNFAEELGIDPDIDFEPAILRNREFLKTSASVTLSQGSIQTEEPELTDELEQTEEPEPTDELEQTDELEPVDDLEPTHTLSFDVTVENHTGHKLPAGYHSRRVYLHVQVLDQNNQVIFESGRLNPNGSIVGLIEDVDPFSWEPHYDVITSENQVQVYQSIVGDINNERTHSLLSGTQFLKDNRLTPSGFDKVAVTNDSTLPASFGIFGAAMDDVNFDSGQDVVSYQVPVPEVALYTVSVSLRYQPLNFGHLQYLWTQGDRVDQVDMFRTIYNATELRDEFIDTDIQIVQ